MPNQPAAAAVSPLAWLRDRLPKKPPSRNEAADVHGVSNGDAAVIRPAPAAAGAERRRHPRIGIEVAVTLASDHNFFMGFSENLSEGGLFIATHQLLEIGHPVDVTFTLPGGRSIAAKTRVAWIRPFNPANESAAPGIGVQFLALPDGDHEAIMKFLRERDPIFYG